MWSFICAAEVVAYKIPLNSTCKLWMENIFLEYLKGYIFGFGFEYTTGFVLKLLNAFWAVYLESHEHLISMSTGRRAPAVHDTPGRFRIDSDSACNLLCPARLAGSRGRFAGEVA